MSIIDVTSPLALPLTVSLSLSLSQSLGMPLGVNRNKMALHQIPAVATPGAAIPSGILWGTLRPCSFRVSVRLTLSQKCGTPAMHPPPIESAGGGSTSPACASAPPGSACMPRERETLHLIQPHRADQMPDPHQGQGFPLTSQCSIGNPIQADCVIQAPSKPYSYCGSLESIVAGVTLSLATLLMTPGKACQVHADCARPASRCAHIRRLTRHRGL